MAAAAVNELHVLLDGRLDTKVAPVDLDRIGAVREGGTPRARGLEAREQYGGVGVAGLEVQLFEKHAAGGDDLGPHRAGVSQEQ